MKTEAFRMKDYGKVTEAWWSRWHPNSSFSQDALSRFGVVVLEHSSPIAVAYIYPAQTAAIAWIGFTCTSPDISRFKAGKAIKLLLQSAEDEIRRLGYNLIYTAFEPKSLQKACASLGYQPGGEVKEYLKRCGNG